MIAHSRRWSPSSTNAVNSNNGVSFNKSKTRHAADLHRSKPWASYWLHRYNKEGLKGLQNKPKSGRIPQIPLEVSARIRKRLMESKQGWTTKQVNDLIVHESGIHYHYTHVYRLLYKWGFKQKVPRKVHVNTASKEEKIQFKKEPRWF